MNKIGFSLKPKENKTHEEGAKLFLFLKKNIANFKCEVSYEYINDIKSAVIKIKNVDLKTIKKILYTYQKINKNVFNDLQFLGGFDFNNLPDVINLLNQEEKNSCLCCLEECNTYFICKKNNCKNLLCINCKDKIMGNYNKCFICKNKIF